jgi:hypothetical protein
LSGFVAVGCEVVVVLETACCSGFVEVSGAEAFITAGAVTAGVAFGSHPGILAVCPFGAFFFFLNNEPRLEIVFAAFETVEAT